MVRRGLPLVLLSLMLAIAIAVELAVYGTLLWQPKLPLAVLLAMPWFLRRRRC